MEHSIYISALAAGIVAGTPLLFAALGEVLAERSGVMNLGVEGMMLVGAVTGFAFEVSTQNLWLAILAALLAGGAMALVHAFLTISLKANQVVSGLALTIFGTGLSAYAGKPLIGIPAPDSFKPVAIPVLSHIPILGRILFHQDMLVYISFLLVAVIWFVLYKTKIGLTVRAVGENPSAADAAGIRVATVRYLSVVLGGMLAGLAGAYLSLANTPAWMENMTAGKGWIAVALVIFAMWNPTRALIGAYIFGTINVLQFPLQTLGVVISPVFLSMLPYLLTFFILIIMTRETRHRRVATPEALGLPYSREER